MMLLKKELKEMGFNAYTWKKTTEAQVYSMDDKIAEETAIKLGQKQIDISIAMDCVQNAMDVIDDRITVALEDDNIGGYNLLTNRKRSFEMILRRLEKKQKEEIKAAEEVVL